jgi:predicted transposase YbfD/YdcC
VKRARKIDERPRLVFRGTVLDQKRLKRIGELIDSGRCWTRQALARELCRVFGWRRANGAWAIRGARQLLIRLQELGVIGLPAPRRAQGRPGREGIEKATTVLRATGASGTGEPSVQRGSGARLVVRPIEAAELRLWRAYMEEFHYLGDAALVGESLRYVALLDGEMAALLSWGAAVLHNRPRDRFVGWDGDTRKANLHLVVNNARFLILPWARRPQLASRVLGANLRRLSRDWQAVYGHRLVLAETFVDPSRFGGTCYRASNWRYVGETQGWTKRGAQYRFHGQPKAVWLYPLRRDFRAQLCTKGGAGAPEEGFMVVDVEKLPLYGQGGLFEILCRVTDPRRRRGVRYKLQSVLAIGICATLAGARSLAAMAEWAAEQSRETLQRLGSKYGRPPSERTLRRVLALISVQEVDRLTGVWVAAQRRLQTGTAVALDGKTVRGSSDGEKGALHLLSAVVHDSATVVAQTPVDSKTNEITQVKPLLEGLDIEGAVITGDALLTQKEVARYVVEDKHADYVFTVKDNQPTLRKDIADLFASEEQEAKRRQRAYNVPPETEAFPPTTPKRR